MPIEVETYNELEEFVDMFKKQAIDLLVVKGPGGTGKTYTTRKRMNNVPNLYINTHITPLDAFKKLQKHKNEPIVIDDIRNLINNGKLLSLFKQTGNTDDKKHIQWNSTTNRLDKDKFDESFDTESNIMIITNTLKTNGDLGKEALLDRGFCIHFTPNKEEIFDRMGEILDRSDVIRKDKVYDFIRDRYDISEKVNLRTLVKALQLKAYGSDWKDIITREMGVRDKFKEIMKLHKKYDKVKDMVEEYTHSESDFYRYKKKLKEKGVEFQ